MASDQLTIATETLTEKRIVLFKLSGHLDAHSFEQLQEALTSTFEKGRHNILLEMSDVPYMSSAGAGVLIGALAESERLGGKLVLLHLKPSVRQVFNVLGIAEIFVLADDRATAIAAF
jgi:anti-sigma B factor antagonist